jgi:glutathione S-transferase
MITLYHAPSTACLVVHWLLIELELPHKLHKLDLEANEHKQPWYLALNPAGRVPTLVTHGRPLREAAAIAMHLVDERPASGFGRPPGTLERAAYYQWMFFLANTMQPAFRAWFYPDEPAGEANIEAVKASARAQLEAGWQQLDDHLAANGPYLLGDAVSTPDFLATMLMRWSRNMPRTANAWPAVDRLARLMKARPAFKEVYAREGLTDWT